MPATTVNSSSVNSKAFQNKLNKVANYRGAAPNRPAGLYAFDTQDMTIVAAQAGDAGDEFFFFTAPGNCKLVEIEYTSSDRDSNVSPTLVEDVISETAAGVETILVTGATSGQAGTVSAMLDRTTEMFMKDISGQKIGLKVTTGAATAAAGTGRLKGIVLIGTPGYAYVDYAN